MNLTIYPDRPALSGHQTFAMRTGWLKKGVDALVKIGPDALIREDALVTLGVGKNMVQSIRHWLLTTGMAQADGRGLKLTELGLGLFAYETAWDPYLEDDATLWLLHWQLAAPLSPAASWVWAFHELSSAAFAKKTLIEGIMTAAAVKMPKAPGSETVSRDVDCLLHTYVPPERAEVSLDTLDCPLQSLGLIQLANSDLNGNNEQRYRFLIGAKPTLPASIFFYALAAFWRWRKADISLTVHEIAYGMGGPARAFKLDEDSVLEYLDDLQRASDGGFRFDDASLTRQVVLPEPGHKCIGDPLYFLRSYYSNV